ncbi:CCD42 protein, partial [Centropus unirufus]|nr:CCD42 protein [Centropus unirufus]
FKERMQVIAGWWRDLHAKRAQLKAYIETCERTLKDNDEMRVHALKKARQERESKLQKKSELLRASEELEALKKQHQKVIQEVEKYSIFKEYLENVLKVSQFEDIQEVIGHYKTLVRLSKDLLQSRQGHNAMSEQGQELLEQYMSEKEAEIQQHKDELKRLQLCFDQVQQDALQWETHLAGIEDATNKKHLELGIIRMTILNLFQ